MALAMKTQKAGKAASARGPAEHSVRDQIVKAARECWSGQGWNASRAEAGDATALALRGRAPFDDALDDAVRAAAEAHFAATAVAVFDALEAQGAVDPEGLR